MDVFKANRIEDMLFIDSSDGPIRIECNFCSHDDYLFSEDRDGTEHGWFLRAVDHHKKYHPERMP